MHRLRLSSCPQQVCLPLFSTAPAGKPSRQLACQASLLLQQQGVERNDNTNSHGNNCRPLIPELHFQLVCILVSHSGVP